MEQLAGIAGEPIWRPRWCPPMEFSTGTIQAGRPEVFGSSDIVLPLGGDPTGDTLGGVGARGVGVRCRPSNGPQYGPPYPCGRTCQRCDVVATDQALVNTALVRRENMYTSATEACREVSH